MQQILSILSLVPAPLILFAIVLVIVPTIVTVLWRFVLYRHLNSLATKTKRVLAGGKLEATPKIIQRLEQKFADSKVAPEQINTAAAIEGAYSQERFYFLGMSLDCEFIDNICRALPNLLLSFGLLGTFLGITFNLSNLSQTITQIDINDVGNLVEELNAPLQGMGVAFTTSLIAIACSSFLSVLNLLWNTRVAKTNLLNYLEDYIDNIFLPKVQPVGSIEVAISQFSQDFDGMVHKLGETIEESMTKAFVKIENSATTFQKAADTLDNSRFPEKLDSATSNLAIAQNQFSQSSLVLHKSTQSFDHNLDSMQKLTKRFLELNQQISNLNQHYSTIVNLNQQKNIVEETGLKEIQQELVKLVNKLQ